jgi:zinc transport system permease protein
MSYLFGDINIVSSRELYLVGLLDLVVVAVALMFYNQFLGVCFDEEYARLRGVPVHLVYLLLLCLTALTVVLMSSIIGIVMVIALLTLPAAIGSQFGARLWQMMLISTVLCMGLTASGMAISYRYEQPSGPTIVVLAGIVYLAVVILTRLVKRKVAT